MKAVLFLFAAASVLRADSVLPKEFEKQRYDDTRSASPFVLESRLIAPPPVPQKRFSENMYVTGISKAEGREVVTIIRAGNESNPLRLWGRTPGPEGIMIHEVKWSDSFGKSRVVLAKDGITEEIGFNENALKTPPTEKKHTGPNPPDQRKRERVILR